MLNVRDDLRDRIAKTRQVGRVDIGEASLAGESLVQAADLASRAAGAIGLGARWRRIDQPTARLLINSVLTMDQAYRGRCMSDPEAGHFADEVMNLVPDAEAYFTNVYDGGSFVVDGKRIETASFDPITTATFSTGIALVGTDRAAVIVVSDED